MDQQLKNNIIVRQLIYLALFIIVIGASLTVIMEFSPQIGTKNEPTLKQNALYPLIAWTLIVFTMLTGLYIATRFFADHSWQKRDFYVSRDSITPMDFVMVLFIFLASSIIVTFATGKIMNESRATVALILAQPAIYIVILLVLFRRIRMRGYDPLFEVGLRTGRFARQLKIGVAAFLFLMPFMLIFEAIARVACSLFNEPVTQNPVIEIFRTEPVGWVKACLVFVPVISAPFFEEVFFRGVLYKLLRSYISAPLAIVISALLFASVHAGLYQGIKIFALGLILGYLVEKTGSIIPSIFLHFLINFTSMVALLMSSV